MDALSRRQLEVVSLLANGRNLEQITEALGISMATAKKHLKDARVRLGAANRIHLAVLAVACGLVKVNAVQEADSEEMADSGPST